MSCLFEFRVVVWDMVSYSKNPKLLALARKAYAVPFKNALPAHRRGELMSLALQSYPRSVPLRGGIERTAARSTGALLGFAVKVFVQSQYMRIGYFPETMAPEALRYADMATIFFAKYKTNRGNSAQHLIQNRGNLKFTFNGTEQEAFLDFERETAIIQHFKDIELVAKDAGWLKEISEVKGPKGRAEQISDLGAEIKALQSELQSFQQWKKDFEERVTKWRTELWEEIWKIKK